MPLRIRLFDMCYCQSPAAAAAHATACKVCDIVQTMPCLCEKAEFLAWMLRIDVAMLHASTSPIGFELSGLPMQLTTDALNGEALERTRIFIGADF